MPENIGLGVLIGFLLIGGAITDRIAEKARKRRLRLYAACDHMIRAFEVLALEGLLTGVHMEPLIEVTGRLERKLWLELTGLSLSIRAQKLVDIVEIESTPMYRRLKVERYCEKSDPMVNLLSMEEFMYIEDQLEAMPKPDQIKIRGGMIRIAISGRPAFQP